VTRKLRRPFTEVLRVQRLQSFAEALMQILSTSWRLAVITNVAIERMHKFIALRNRPICQALPACGANKVMPS